VSSKLDYAFRFATSCDRYNIKPADLRNLLAASEKAFRAGERYANSGAEKDNVRNTKTGDLVEKIAAEIGLTTTWPGLFPAFTDDEGNPVHMPAE